MNDEQRRTTDVNIRKYIGTYDDFILTTMSLQNNNTVFIDKTQKERKELMAQFMGLGVFDELYVLTGGGPGTSTSLIVQYIFTTGFASSGSVQNFGLAAAASMVLGVVLLFLTLMQLYFSRNKESKHQEI